MEIVKYPDGTTFLYGEFVQASTLDDTCDIECEPLTISIPLEDLDKLINELTLVKAYLNSELIFTEEDED